MSKPYRSRRDRGTHYRALSFLRRVSHQYNSRVYQIPPQLINVDFSGVVADIDKLYNVPHTFWSGGKNSDKDRASNAFFSTILIS